MEMKVVRPGLDEVEFFAMGGSEEIGMNLYVYRYDGRMLIVDFGITFGDDSTPGVDVIMPDIGFLEENRDAIDGIVLTHGHEDHFGALQYLWPRLNCPVYCTPFTATFLALKLQGTSFASEVPIVEVPLSGRRTIGAFDIEFISVTHSIPEPNALVIRVGDSTVVHSGDWKLDPDPMVGDVTDVAALRRLGDEGVTAFICDSTNAMEAGRSGSERTVQDALTRLIAERTGRIAVTCFSTNVARLNAVAHAAHAAGRHCALVGRSLWRIHEAATRCGYIDVPEPFVSETDAGFLPPDKVVLVCTGSQGEARSALARIARNDHPNIVLTRGDTVIFSAREIPGNEKSIGRVQNNLIRLGVRVITPDDEEGVHVSGHPAADELAEMYQWLRPGIVVPVHGTVRHLEANAAIARSCQVPEVVLPHDGAVIRLTPGAAGIVDEVPVGQTGLDGHRLIAMNSGVIRARHKVINNGAAVATVVLNGKGEAVTAPRVTLIGLDGDSELAASQDTVADDVADVIDAMPRADRMEDTLIQEVVRRAVRRSVRQTFGKKPVTEVHVVRV
ncbi:ribonuclease J [Fodinicurvata sp. EGI_FJ10296]|uniref:ribonuclease J n=1 Tax=Fodinicurvata sp. EGI_FJ10296 TaxID=3231908 RepID=UPI003453CC18